MMASNIVYINDMVLVQLVLCNSKETKEIF